MGTCLLILRMWSVKQLDSTVSNSRLRILVGWFDHWTFAVSMIGTSWRFLRCQMLRFNHFRISRIVQVYINNTPENWHLCILDFIIVRFLGTILNLSFGVNFNLFVAKTEIIVSVSSYLIVQIVAISNKCQTIKILIGCCLTWLMNSNHTRI